MSSLLDFIDRLITGNGGLVEWSSSQDSLQALLSKDLGNRLDLEGSLVSISDRADTEGAFIGYGTVLLENAMSLALEQGRTAAVRMPMQSSRKKASANLERHLSLLNAVYSLQGVRESWLDYWLWSFSTAAEADERQDGLLHVCISSRRTECPGLAELIHEQALEWDEMSFDSMQKTAEQSAEIHIVAVARALDELQRKSMELKDVILRHHARDIGRIKDYFEELRQEMEREIIQRELTGEALEIRKEKQAQLEKEESAKLVALIEKYKMRLSFEPRALMLARIPTIRYDLLVKRRKSERQISAVYNMLNKRFDPFACEACGADAREVGFCDQKLHLLCARCLSKSGGRGRADCPACNGEHPPSSIEEVLKRRGFGELKSRVTNS
ncbi:MAG: hypothetical protein GY854_16430 [Deltaproteobacteria bacterium]|nr:hypothetical protein [Deltaproteobacteria bacterium]